MGKDLPQAKFILTVWKASGAMLRNVLQSCHGVSGKKDTFQGICAVALPFATRFVLRGGTHVVAPVEAAFGIAPPTRPLASASEGPRAALWQGPDEWLLIAEEEAGDLAAKLEAALGGVFHSLVDVSHRQTAMRCRAPRRRGC